MRYKFLLLCNILWCVAGAVTATAGSFETSLEGWQPYGGTECGRKSLSNGVPKAAVTAGKFCFELISPNGGKWSQLTLNKSLTDKIKNSETMSLDLYVPGKSLPTSGWAVFQIRLLGGKGAKPVFDITHKVTLDISAKSGKLYNISWNYGADSKFSNNINWSQLSLIKIASGGTMSPLYIDNVRFTGKNSKVNTPVAVGAQTKTGINLKDWQLIWADEFNGKQGAPPARHWSQGITWKKDDKWRDSTLSMKEAYLDGQGNLILRTRYVEGKRLAPYLVTSDAGNLPKDRRHTWGPGEHGIYIEWRVNVSKFKAYAAWFAIWIFADKPYTGDRTKGSEIDVMEYVPYKCQQYTLMNKFHAAAHVGDKKPSARPPAEYGFTEFDETKWHTWGLEWYKDRQIFYLDGKVFWRNSKNVSTSDTHGIRMTIEIENGKPEKNNCNAWGHPVGKFEDNPPSRLPSYASIDYVRVYRKVAP